jgi:hypothetical protein
VGLWTSCKCTHRDQLTDWIVKLWVEFEQSRRVKTPKLQQVVLDDGVWDSSWFCCCVIAKHVSERGVQFQESTPWRAVQYRVWHSLYLNSTVIAKQCFPIDQIWESLGHSQPKVTSRKWNCPCCVQTFQLDFHLLPFIWPLSWDFHEKRGTMASFLELLVFRSPVKMVLYYWVLFTINGERIFISAYAIHRNANAFSPSLSPMPNSLFSFSRGV